MTVVNLLKQRQRQKNQEAKESGTKQPDTELTDRLDCWQQYLDDIQKLDDKRTASKATKDAAKLRFRDRRDDLLLGLNAKRALENSQDDDNDNENDDETIDSRSSRKSQRLALKHRRKTLRQSEVVVKVEAVDKGLSKDD